jgi:hypothetical protein
LTNALKATLPLDVRRVRMPQVRSLLPGAGRYFWSWLSSQEFFVVEYRKLWSDEGAARPYYH